MGSLYIRFTSSALTCEISDLAYKELIVKSCDYHGNRFCPRSEIYISKDAASGCHRIMISNQEWDIDCNLHVFVVSRSTYTCKCHHWHHDAHGMCIKAQTFKLNDIVVLRCMRWTGCIYISYMMSVDWNPMYMSFQQSFPEKLCGSHLRSHPLLGVVVQRLIIRDIL